MEYLTLGKIIDTFSLDGSIKILSSTTNQEIRYKKGNKVYLYNENTEDLKEVHVDTFKKEKGFDLVSFKELKDINLIEPYLKYKIVVDKDELPPLGKDDYYHDDLIGCEVYDDTLLVGKVIEIEEYSSTPSLRIKRDNKADLLLPFTKPFLIELSP